MRLDTYKRLEKIFNVYLLLKLIAVKTDAETTQQ